MKEREGRGPDPGVLFAPLRDRSTEEVDGGALWQEIASRLEPRRHVGWRRPLAAAAWPPAGRRLAVYGYGLAAVATLVLAVWIGAAVWRGTGSGPPSRPQALAQVPETGAAPSATETSEQVEGSRIVWLQPAGSEGSTTPAPAPADTPLRLQVRLVRGYGGVAPRAGGDRATADAGEAADELALGAGGADLLADVRSGVASLLPYDRYGLVGRWEGGLAAGQAVEAVLSESFSLSFVAAERVADEPLELRDVRLRGVGQTLVAASLRLQPGRLYLLGVVPAGEDVPSLILAVEASAPRPGRDNR
ncbi:MAG: hypothetical protein ACE5HV_13770 [Acidobacteriota bacterium]